MKTKKSRRFAESRPVCVGLKTAWRQLEFNRLALARVKSVGVIARVKSPGVSQSSIVWRQPQLIVWRYSQSKIAWRQLELNRLALQPEYNRLALARVQSSGVSQSSIVWRYSQSKIAWRQLEFNRLALARVKSSGVSQSKIVWRQPE